MNRRKHTYFQGDNSTIGDHYYSCNRFHNGHQVIWLFSTGGISLILWVLSYLGLQRKYFTIQIFGNIAPAFVANTTVVFMILSFYYHQQKIMLKMTALITYQRHPFVHIGGLMQERLNSIANALELRLSCTKPSICKRFPRLLCGQYGLSPTMYRTQEPYGLLQVVRILSSEL